jgi:hypothetical protein
MFIKIFLCKVGGLRLFKRGTRFRVDKGAFV